MLSLDEIEALANAATKGPYIVCHSDQTHEELAAEILAMLKKGGDKFYFLLSQERVGGDTQNTTICDIGNGPNGEANARFLAASRDLVPQLVARVRELEAPGQKVFKTVEGEMTEGQLLDPHAKETK